MKQRLFVCLASLIGAFGIYCSQAAITSSGSASSGSGGPGGPGGASSSGSAGTPGSPVPDAHADTPGCCAPAAPVFTKLGEGDVSVTGQAPADTPPIDVSAYRQVSLLETRTDGTGGGCSSVWAGPGFRLDPSAPFGTSGQWMAGGVVRTDGPTMSIHYVDKGSTTDSCTIHWVVVGVK